MELNLDEFKGIVELVKGEVTHSCCNNTKIKEDIEQIFVYVTQRDKIGAIKKYRELTGEGLREAKETIEIIY